MAIAKIWCVKASRLISCGDPLGRAVTAQLVLCTNQALSPSDSLPIMKRRDANPVLVEQHRPDELWYRTLRFETDGLFVYNGPRVSIASKT